MLETRCPQNLKQFPAGSSAFHLHVQIRAVRPAIAAAECWCCWAARLLRRQSYSRDQHQPSLNRHQHRRAVVPFVMNSTLDVGDLIVMLSIETKCEGRASSLVTFGRMS